jgi:hypothetical protein
LRAFAVLAASAALICAAPLLGVLAVGRPVSPYLHFPPRSALVAHAPFSWTAFAAYSVPAIAAAALFVIALARARAGPPPARRRFPAWGWAGAALIGIAWVLDWSEYALPPPWRTQMFTLLWLGYIVAMNALVVRRGGHAPLVDRSAWFLSLFPVSAAAWWLFEYLNQFTANWHYTGVDAGNDVSYVLQATPPFATVLPAVASTWAWLATFPRMQALALPAIGGHRSVAWIAVAAGFAGLAGAAVWREQLFSMLWLAPLLVVAGLQQLVLGRSLFAPLRNGDWRCILQPALAALICGFFWELWNDGSIVKWHYSIPYVQRFHVFEMPLLGYAGYLPFGVECALIMQLVATLIEGRSRTVPS